MPEFRHPGIHVDEISTRTPVITGARNRCPLFIGACDKGEPGVPVRVDSWSDFQAKFGDGDDGATYRAVYAWFRNSAWDIYVARTSSGTAPAREYRKILESEVLARQVEAVLLPGLVWDDHGRAIIASVISHCEARGDRMVIFDLPLGCELRREADAEALKLPTSPHAATYYPWPRLRNPHYAAGTDPRSKKFWPASPAALAATQWTEAAAQRGVWKAPAGLDTRLAGVRKLQYKVTDEQQDWLNRAGINTIRKFSGHGRVLWGARTLATSAEPEWRYIPVKRTAMYIQSSIYESTRWVVFEPNDHNLWIRLRASIGQFLNELFREGAFQGEKAGDAWFVRCGLGETMVQDDVDHGRVIVALGFAPMRPAEFIVLSIVLQAAPASN